MNLALTVLTGASCAAWLYLVFFHGGFWRADQRIGDGAIRELESWPPVLAIVPARDEADVVARNIHSLLAQDYPRPVQVVLVDDNSSDDTVAAARSAAADLDASARLIVVDGQAMPPGWVGKVWAMSQGVDRAAALNLDARYILFSDADIDHDPSCLRRLVARAESGRLDLVSLMVMLSVGGFWGRLLIPPFVFFFQMLFPFSRVNDPANRTAAAAGGCMLVRWSALNAAGGMAAIRNALIDDCALARLISQPGGKLWLGLTTGSRSLRPYAGFSEIWNMVARSAYTQLDHSPVRLGLCLAGMAVVYVAPVVAMIGYMPHNPTVAATGFAAYAMMCLAYLPTVRLYRQAWPAALLLPFSAAIYSAMTIGSAWRHWRGRAGGWKGRIYPG